MDRVLAKRQIDFYTKTARDVAFVLDMMPTMYFRSVPKLFSEKINLTSSSRKLFLKHAHHSYDVIAAIHVWNHPEAMEYVSLHSIEEGKEIFDYEILGKIINKMERGVMEYVRYRLCYEGRVFTVKTELTFSYYEQFYAIYEERG